jgi:hypothetical protein
MKAWISSSASISVHLQATAFALSFVHCIPPGKTCSEVRNWHALQCGECIDSVSFGFFSAIFAFFCGNPLVARASAALQHPVLVLASAYRSRREAAAKRRDFHAPPLSYPVFFRSKTTPKTS